MRRHQNPSHRRHHPARHKRRHIFSVGAHGPRKDAGKRGIEATELDLGPHDLIADPYRGPPVASFVQFS
ncbi:hypothetical protein [Pandoravirus japonicus]|uniref:Uncharacterized protein n=1 Tax=Pandoravirus japonicus TaxID=2823154 RepID=A0A811BLP9_9VIRU|nr:hypothetical protein [Pandoravirus japonicus]